MTAGGEGLTRQLVSDMAHELRGPLNTIVGFTELMHDGRVGPVSAAHREHLADVLGAARDLARLLDDRVDLARLDLGQIDTNPDYYASLKDVVDGKLDVQSFYLFDVVLFNAQGADLVAVLTGDQTSGAEGLAARPPVRAVRDLRGRRVGVSPGTFLEYVLSVALEREGLSLGDVRRVDVPGEQAADALVRGTVDAVLTWEPVLTQAVERTGGRRLFDTRELVGTSLGAVALQRRFVETRAADVQALVDVWHRTTRLLTARPPEAFGLIAGIYGKTPAEVEAFARTDRILGLEGNLAAFAMSGRLESLHGAAREIHAHLVRVGLARGRLDTTRLAAARFVRALRAP